MEEMVNAYRILVGKTEGKRLLARPMLRWEDNIRIDLKKKWDMEVWVGLFWHRIRINDGFL
jgi:hypothetical protein